MPFYRDHIYPYLVDVLGDPPSIREIRQQIIPLAQGIVLEIGAGSGLNFIHYNSAQVNKLYALEPNLGMIRRAEQQQRKTKLNIEFLDLPGERIPLEDGSVDTVVSTFTLCTIVGIMDAILGIAHVLKPNGKLIFFELGLSTDPEVQRWQKRLEPYSPLAIPGLVPDEEYSIFNRTSWFSDRAGGNGIFSPISEVLIMLLVGHRNTAITPVIG